MKKTVIFITAILLVLSVKLYSQVGINTDNNPQGVFHIDPQANTSALLNGLDDVIIDVNGQMGIGTLTPRAKLDLNGTLRIKDGTEANNKILTTNATGVAFWRYMVVADKIEGVIPVTMSNVIASTTFSYMNISITLPPGSWQINFKANYKNSGNTDYNIWWDLAKVETGWSLGQSVGRVLSYTAQPGTLSPSFVTYFVSNTESQTYYLWACSQNAETGTLVTYDSGAKFWAIPVLN